MIRSLDFYRGLILGLGIMYLLDPEQGRARRARVRDQGARGMRSMRTYFGKAGRDLRNRTQGAVAKTTSRIRSDHPDDESLVERVRAKLGRYVSHPHAVDVEAEAGRVTLHGPILRGEIEDLIAAVSSVRGVSEVVNQLEPHETPEGVPSLQGPSRFDARPHGVMPPAVRSPGVQLLAGLLGATLVACGAALLAARVRNGRHEAALELEEEMPEYAMLR